MRSTYICRQVQSTEALSLPILREVLPIHIRLAKDFGILCCLCRIRTRERATESSHSNAASDVLSKKVVFRSHVQTSLRRLQLSLATAQVSRRTPTFHFARRGNHSVSVEVYLFFVIHRTEHFIEYTWVSSETLDSLDGTAPVPPMDAEEPYASTLHMAAQAGNIDAVRKVLSAGILVTTKDRIGRSALQWAIVCKQTEAAKVLLVNTPRQALQCADKYGRTALHYAAGLGDAILTRIIIDRGAFINAKDKQGVTALHLAAENVKPDIPSLLLERGAVKLAKDNFGRLPVHYALRKCAMAAVHLLAVREEAIRISPSNGMEIGCASDLASETLEGVTPLIVSPSEFWAKRKIRRLSAKAVRSSHAGVEDFTLSTNLTCSPAWPGGKNVEVVEPAVQIERIGVSSDFTDKGRIEAHRYIELDGVQSLDGSIFHILDHSISDSVRAASDTANKSSHVKWSETGRDMSHDIASASYRTNPKRVGFQVLPRWSPGK